MKKQKQTPQAQSWVTKPVGVRGTDRRGMDQPAMAERLVFNAERDNILREKGTPGLCCTTQESLDWLARSKAHSSGPIPKSMHKGNKGGSLFPKGQLTG